MKALRAFLGAIICAAALTSGVPVALAAAQVVNPQFVEARDLYQAISASSLSPEIKADLRARFPALEAEQRELWSLAGEVDRIVAGGGEIPWLETYKARIVAWQVSLQAFSADVRSALQKIQVNAELPLETDGFAALRFMIERNFPSTPYAIVAFEKLNGSTVESSYYQMSAFALVDFPNGLAKGAGDGSFSLDSFWESSQVDSKLAALGQQGFLFVLINGKPYAGPLRFRVNAAIMFQKTERGWLPRL